MVMMKQRGWNKWRRHLPKNHLRKPKGHMSLTAVPRVILRLPFVLGTPDEVEICLKLWNGHSGLAHRCGQRGKDRNIPTPETIAKAPAVLQNLYLRKRHFPIKSSLELFTNGTYPSQPPPSPQPVEILQHRPTIVVL